MAPQPEPQPAPLSLSVVLVQQHTLAQSGELLAGLLLCWMWLRLGCWETALLCVPGSGGGLYVVLLPCLMATQRCSLLYSFTDDTHVLMCRVVWHWRGLWCCVIRWRQQASSGWLGLALAGVGSTCNSDRFHCCAWSSGAAGCDQERGRRQGGADPSAQQPAS